jgi:hypothetical protein
VALTAAEPETVAIHQTMHCIQRMRQQQEHVAQRFNVPMPLNALSHSLGSWTSAAGGGWQSINGEKRVLRAVQAATEAGRHACNSSFTAAPHFPQSIFASSVLLPQQISHTTNHHKPLLTPAE